ncbi:hypothetical protein QTI33_16225 [Variovorax sp. J22P271]|uniref:hypothetical protein n=1 Tax=Variovorax davisae TaxID=3053515 RepID=UPI00257665CF|nr:hypothetical protein [Variovorax sp. J22P271]MDM0033681.1 hypothetical protein [Variovorax sp. J22P271]
MTILAPHSFGVGNIRDVSVSGDGSHVYTAASGPPYRCASFGPAWKGETPPGVRKVFTSTNRLRWPSTGPNALAARA